MGGADAVAAVRKALQLGVDHAVHVSDAAVAGSDVFGTATVLAAAVRKIAEDGAGGSNGAGGRTAQLTW